MGSIAGDQAMALFLLNCKHKTCSDQFNSAMPEMARGVFGSLPTVAIVSGLAWYALVRRLVGFEADYLGLMRARISIDTKAELIERIPLWITALDDSDASWYGDMELGTHGGEWLASIATSHKERESVRTEAFSALAILKQLVEGLP